MRSREERIISRRIAIASVPGTLLTRHRHTSSRTAHTSRRSAVGLFGAALHPARVLLLGLVGAGLRRAQRRPPPRHRVCRQLSEVPTSEVPASEVPASAAWSSRAPAEKMPASVVSPWTARSSVRSSANAAGTCQQSKCGVGWKAERCSLILTHRACRALRARTSGVASWQAT